jgi:hypothetical protein
LTGFRFAVLVITARSGESCRATDQVGVLLPHDWSQGVGSGLRICGDELRHG